MGQEDNLYRKLLLQQEIQLRSFLKGMETLVSNDSYESLVETYKEALKFYKNINRVCIYILLEKKLEYFLSHNTINSYKNRPLPKEFLFKTIKHSFTSDKHFEEFDTIIPLRHKGDIKSYLLIGWGQNKEDNWIEEMTLIKSLTSIVVIIHENKKMKELEKDREKYRIQLKLAQIIQKKLFDPQLPYNNKLKLFSSYIPNYFIGGDYFCYKRLNDEQIFMCISDVSYKGLSAGLIVSNFQAAIDVILQYTHNLPEIARGVNQVITSYNDSIYYVSACFFIYDFSKKELRAVNSGHPFPFLFDFNTNKCLRVKKGTTLIGFHDKLSEVQEEVFHHLDNFLLFCFTDGLTDFNLDDEMSFDEKDLERWLLENISMDQKELHTKLLNQINELNTNEEYDDDITLFSCKIQN